MSMPKTRTILRTVGVSLFAFALALAGAVWVHTSQSDTVYAGQPTCKVDQLPGKDNCVAPPAEETCDSAVGSCTRGADCTGDDCGLIEKYINPIINLLAGLVGIVISIVIVWGGIQYSSSADDPGKVSAAKSKIMNAIIALLGFLFMYVFLQWLVPGGFLNGE